MHGFSGTNADQDSQHFHASGSLCHCGIEAVAALFDRRKMESGGIRDRLQEIGVCCVSVGPGNCRMLPRKQSWDGLRELEIGIEVRVVGAAAIPSPPTGV